MKTLKIKNIFFKLEKEKRSQSWLKHYLLICYFNVVVFLLLLMYLKYLVQTTTNVLTRLKCSFEKNKTNLVMSKKNLSGKHI